MKQVVDPSENLYRAIRTIPFLWDNESNRPSTAAFKDPKGLSVDRDGHRSDDEMITTFKDRFGELKSVVRISASYCYEISAHVVANPSKNNKFHAEIHNTETEKKLSKSKQLKLSKNCEIIYLK